MDGIDSDKFENFKSLLQAGLIEVRKHMDDLESLITIMAKGKLLVIDCLDSQMPCFKRPMILISEIKERLKPTPS